MFHGLYMHLTHPSKRPPPDTVGTVGPKKRFLKALATVLPARRQNRISLPVSRSDFTHTRLWHQPEERDRRNPNVFEAGVLNEPPFGPSPPGVGGAETVNRKKRFLLIVACAKQPLIQQRVLALNVCLTSGKPEEPNNGIGPPGLKFPPEIS
jgi:hypothetical protein